MKCSLGISNYLEEISSLSHSIVSLYFFALIPEEGFLSFLAILWNSAYKWVYLYFSPLLFTSLLFTAIWKASSESHFAFLHFFFLGMVLIPVSCTMLQTSVHSSSVAIVMSICDSMDCSPPGSSLHGDSPGKNTGVDCHALLQGISQARGWTWVSWIFCVADSSPLSHRGNPW